MDKTIYLYFANKYGNNLVYVQDKETAGQLAKLTGCETLADRHMAALKGLGFAFATSDPLRLVPTWARPYLNLHTVTPDAKP